MTLNCIFRNPFITSTYQKVTKINTNHSLKIARFISKKNFKYIFDYTHSFIKENSRSLQLQKNESGFVRISVPMIPLMQIKFQEISKIRLNFWSPEARTAIIPESVHTHPSYFRSYILCGGYTHELFLENFDGEDYSRYRICKNGENKTIELIGKTSLRILRTENFIKGDFPAFSTNLIHRVLYTIPETLSLNMVSQKLSNENYYDVFISKNGTVNDIKTKREILKPFSSEILVNRIIRILDNFKKGQV